MQHYEASLIKNILKYVKVAGDNYQCPCLVLVSAFIILSCISCKRLRMMRDSTENASLHSQPLPACTAWDVRVHHVWKSYDVLHRAQSKNIHVIMIICKAFNSFSYYRNT